MALPYETPMRLSWDSHGPILSTAEHLHSPHTTFRSFTKHLHSFYTAFTHAPTHMLNSLEQGNNLLWFSKLFLHVKLLSDLCGTCP